MLISQAALATLWFASLLAGIGFGGIWDLLRLPRIWLGEIGAAVGYRELCAKELPWIGSRNTRKPSRFLPIVRFLSDFLFCILAGLTMILLFYQINRGNVRFPALLCAAGGFFLYRATLGRLVLRALSLIAFLIQTIMRYLIFFLGMPFRMLVKAIKHTVCRAWNHYRARRWARARKQQTRLFWEALAKDACGLIPTRDGDVKQQKEVFRERRSKKAV